MSHDDVFKATNTFEIQRYERSEDIQKLRRRYIPFSGSPHLHPEDPKTVILVTDPYASRTSAIYYEFKADSIAFVDELPNIVDLDGNSVRMVRIWVKKRSVGIACKPFLVEEV